MLTLRSIDTWCVGAIYKAAAGAHKVKRAAENQCDRRSVRLMEFQRS